MGLPMMPSPMKPVIGLLMINSYMLLRVLCTPGNECAQKATEVLDRKNQSKGPGHDFMVPKNRHGDGHERPIKHRRENEPFRVQASAGDVEHAEPANEDAHQSIIIRALFGEGSYAKNGCGKVRRKEHDNSFNNDQPAKHFDCFG